jgi:hypothetical protein
MARLDAAHEILIGAISPLESELFSKRPSESEWSVGEIVHHLCLVEERVIEELEKALTHEPRRPSVIRRLVPTSIVASRLIKVKAPRAVNPVGSPPKAVAISNLNKVRQRFKELCLTHGRQRLKQAIFKHPFLGEIDGLATVSFIGYHEQRHCKQIREVLSKLKR